jgi:hypothetical protein
MDQKLSDAVAPVAETFAAELERSNADMAMPRHELAEINPTIKLLPEKVLFKLAEYNVEIRDPNAVVAALTFGEKGDPRVPDEVKLELVRGCVRDNTEAVKTHQAFREGILKAIAVEPADIEAVSALLPNRSPGDLHRAAVYAKLLSHTFDGSSAGEAPNYQKWNPDQLMEAFNVFRTLGMHAGAIQLFETVERHYADNAQPSPWSADAQHLYSYALNRTGNAPAAQRTMEGLLVDGRETVEMGGAGPLSFAGLAEDYTKSARLLESVINRVEGGGRVTEAEQAQIGNMIVNLPLRQLGEIFEKVEQQALVDGNGPLAAMASNIRQSAVDFNEAPSPVRVEHMLEVSGYNSEMLRMIRDQEMSNAMISARQGFLETGSAYAGLHYLRRVSEREVELVKDVQSGKIQGDALVKAQEELTELERMRTHLPTLINNANIAEGGANPVLVWNRGDVLETAILRGQDHDSLQRNLDKLLIAVEREAEPLKTNPLYKVPGVEGPGWKLGMIMRRIETGETLAREQLELARSGETRFGSVEMLETRVATMNSVVNQLHARVSLYEATGKVFSADERRELDARHMATETPGEALGRWSYTLREAISSPLPMEIPGSAKSRGGLIQSYTTNEQDKGRGTEVLSKLGIEGPLTDQSITDIQRYIRDRFHTKDLMNLTAQLHKSEFDLPQDLGYAVGGGGAYNLRMGHGCPTSLFAAVELTPGDCRAHAQLFGGLSDLQSLAAYHTMHQESLVALWQGDMATFARLQGQAIPDMLRREITQTTAEMYVTGKVDGTYDFPHGANKDIATFVERDWKPGDPLTNYEKKSAIIVINAGTESERIVHASRAADLKVEPGDTVTLATKAEEHTYSNETTYALKPVGGTSPKVIEGIQMMEPDRDIVEDYRARDAFYNRQFVARDAEPEKQSVYDLGNRELRVAGWQMDKEDRMPILDGGPINVEKADGTVVEGRTYMVPRYYSKNPIMYDTMMATAIKAFGMDAPEIINQLEPTVARAWYDSWIYKIKDLTDGILESKPA